MKTHLSYIALILLLLSLWYMNLRKQQSKIEALNGNISALVQDTTERAAKFIVTGKEMAQIAPQTYNNVKQFEKDKGGKVREVHVIKYLAGSVVHDTVFLKVSNSTPLSESPCCELQRWEFPHGCVTSVVTFDPLNQGITDSLFGSISIDRYVLAERPRWRIFKPRMWNSRNWPTSVRLENNCGLEIKENTIFEIH